MVLTLFHSFFFFVSTLSKPAVRVSKNSRDISAGRVVNGQNLAATARSALSQGQRKLGSRKNDCAACTYLGAKSDPCCMREPIVNHSALFKENLFSKTSAGASELHGRGVSHSYGLNLKNNTQKHVHALVRGRYKKKSRCTSPDNVYRKNFVFSVVEFFFFEQPSVFLLLLIYSSSTV